MNKYNRLSKMSSLSLGFFSIGFAASLFFCVIISSCVSVTYVPKKPSPTTETQENETDTNTTPTDERGDDLAKKQNRETRPLRPFQGWVLGTTALLTERNQDQHDLLGSLEMTDANAEITRQSLARWWGIRSRKDLLNSLKWLDEGGHRKEFAYLGNLIVNAEHYEELLAEAPNENVYYKIVIVKKYYDEDSKDKRLMSWDYNRYIWLCRFSYLSGYISEEEAWEKIMPVARKLQSTFDSWKDLGQDYLIGREYWTNDPEEAARFQTIYQKLLNDPESPWNLYPWDANLDDTP